MSTSTDFYGRGRRKRATARVWLSTDAAIQTVNSQPVDEYFATVEQQAEVRKPLQTTSLEGTVGFTARVTGGGKASQADAVKLGLARAIVSKDEQLQKQLKDTGALTRDARTKERKKYGIKRARRAPQFSKR